MSPTETKMSEAKAKAQAEVLAMLDKHFARYTVAGQNKKLTIDMVEEFMGEAMAEGERIIKEAATNALNALETDFEKKHMPAM